MARALGVHCVLQAAGHQPAAVLRATGAPVADDVRLAAAIDWDGFEKAYSALFAPGGKVALPARVALGCRIIQLHYAASDREVVALVQESPYLQYFLGFESFTDAVPFSSRTVARFRARIPDKAVRPAVRLLRSFQ